MWKPTVPSGTLRKSEVTDRWLKQCVSANHCQRNLRNTQENQKTKQEDWVLQINVSYCHFMTSLLYFLSHENWYILHFSASFFSIKMSHERVSKFLNFIGLARPSHVMEFVCLFVWGKKNVDQNRLLMNTEVSFQKLFSNPGIQQFILLLEDRHIILLKVWSNQSNLRIMIKAGFILFLTYSASKVVIYSLQNSSCKLYGSSDFIFPLQKNVFRSQHLLF